jgi:diaminopropionate ammonia-lyase
MGRLDCKAPSHAALKYLALEADYLMTLEDEFVSNEITLLDKFDLQTSPSGGAGFAGLIYCLKNSLLDISDQSRVLIFISEGPSDD